MQPKSRLLKLWIAETYKHMGLKLGVNSIDYLKAPQIREIWLQLLIDAAESGIEEAPLSLLQQAVDLLELHHDDKS